MDIEQVFSSNSTPLGFGGASISGEGKGYGFGDISEKDSIYLLHSAFELGIKVYDTAPIYGFGTSESRIGKAFKGSNRERVFLVSKSGVTWSFNKRVDKDNSKKNTQKMLEESLRRLDTDYIDLFLIHWPDPRHPTSEALEVLEQAQEQGKIRSFGVCNSNLDEMNTFLPNTRDKIFGLQEKWNLFSSNKKQMDAMVKQLPSLQLLLTYATLDKGILTQRVVPGRKFDSNDARSWAPWWKQDKKEWRMACVQTLTEKLSLSLHDILSIGIFHSRNLHPRSIPLVGFRNYEQLHSAYKAAISPVNQEMYHQVIEFIESFRSRYEA